jgi:hypothetical protein
MGLRSYTAGNQPAYAAVHSSNDRAEKLLASRKNGRKPRASKAEPAAAEGAAPTARSVFSTCYWIAFEVDAQVAAAAKVPERPKGASA